MSRFRHASARLLACKFFGRYAKLVLLSGAEASVVLTQTDALWDSPCDRLVDVLRLGANLAGATRTARKALAKTLAKTAKGKGFSWQLRSKNALARCSKAGYTCGTILCLRGTYGFSARVPNSSVQSPPLAPDYF